MRLEGVHHVTLITGDAPRNVDFYTRVLGLRLVKKTVNQDDPTVYHLFYADEQGSAGSDITFFEYPGAARGTAGPGMVHTIVWRVGSEDALDFWEQRLAGRAESIDALRTDSLTFEDPEGVRHELAVDDDRRRAARRQASRDPRRARTPGLRRRARVCARARAEPRLLEETLALRAARRRHLGGARRQARRLLRLRPPPDGRGVPGAGTVHHVAWATNMDEHDAWQQRVAEAGLRPTPVIDRFYFKSIYFREPNGILFELATLGPGFATDEDPEHLGERLSLPPAFEHLREQIEPALTPLPNPRG